MAICDEYLRLLATLTAASICGSSCRPKRGQCSKTKSGYWYYQHLDHDKRRQANALIADAARSPGGKSPLPLYIF